MASQVAHKRPLRVASRMRTALSIRAYQKLGVPRDAGALLTATSAAVQTSSGSVAKACRRPAAHAPRVQEGMAGSTH